MATLEEAKNIIKETPISSIVSFYHAITKKGGNFEGLCPFHSDSHPSLKINDSKGIYKCFVCGAAGDAIKFVQDHESISFVESVKDIASKIGITVEEQKKFKPNPKFEMGLRVINSAYKLYRKVALDMCPSAYGEFLKKRNLNEESVSNFGIGFSPANNAFSNYLKTIPEKDRDFALKVAMEVGLVREGKWGQYDFYRDRVMFPIWDHSGNIRGFSSRAVRDDQKPKYLNSGESFVFDKASILYGFNLAKNEIRNKDAVILVEGNMDVVALHQFGFKNSVGTMGVALSEQSVKLLCNLTKNIFLGMDSDNAGLVASQKINASFMAQGVLPKFLSYAPEKDPDDFLNKFGRLELQQRIEKAPTFLDYYIEQTLPDPIPSATDAKLALLHEVFAIIAPLKEGLVAKEKVIQCARSIGLQSSSDDIVLAYTQFLNELESSVKKFNKPQKQKKIESVSRPPEVTYDYEHYEQDNFHEVDYQEQINAEQAPPLDEKPAFPPPTRLEGLMLEKIISHPECLDASQMVEILDLMGNNEVKQFILWLKKIYLEIDDNEYINIIKTKLSSDEFTKDIKDLVASALFHCNFSRLENKVMEKLMNDFLFRLQEDSLKKQRNELKTRQKNSLTQEESLSIISEIQNLEQRLFELKSNRN